MNMGSRVRGKVALVTGSALGIGRACAKVLASEGAAVAVTDINDEAGQTLVDEICAAGGTAGFWHLDVSSEQEVKDVVRMVKSKFGQITILVNNAGISGVNKPTHEVNTEDWDRLMAINVKGVFLCTKHVLPCMMGARKGSIINISSIYGMVGAPDVPPYHASKGAVRLMTKTDAITYAQYGIRVNSVNPGFIYTPMVEAYLTSKGGDAETWKKAVGGLHPLGHMGNPKISLTECSTWLLRSQSS